MISYAITVKDEIEEIKKLVDALLQLKGEQDEIVIIRDSKNDNQDVKTYLANQSGIKVFDFFFEDDFSKLKNFMNRCCSNPWIFNIDADEMPHETLLQNIHEILEQNNEIDAIWVPRINIVNGITPEHITKWKWIVNERGWINWPHDAQCRIYKNTPDIYWHKPVHEQLTGSIRNISKLPDLEELSLYHIKDIERQERQNEFYSKI